MAERSIADEVKILDEILKYLNAGDVVVEEVDGHKFFISVSQHRVVGIVDKHGTAVDGRHIRDNDVSGYLTKRFGLPLAEEGARRKLLS